MRHYNEIVTSDQFEALLVRLRGFHDALLKEIHVVNRGFVRPDGAMDCAFRHDARVLVQSQLGPMAVELLFIGVEELVVGTPDEFWSASGKVEVTHVPNEVCRVSVSFGEAMGVTASRLLVVDRADWLGARARFGSEVPAPECVGARQIDSRWRQCLSCADAFEASPEEVYVLCTGCGHLTELDGSRYRPGAPGVAVKSPPMY